MGTPVTPELISSLWSPTDPQLSPDGSRVAWTAAPYGKDGEHAEQGIWIATLDRPASAKRWTHGADDGSPRWSPDGSRLAFLSDRKTRGTHGLYVLDLDGGEARPLVTRERSVAGHAWSPDGTRIAYLAPDEPSEDDKRREKERDDPDVYGERWRHQRLWIVDADGGEPLLAWAPDFHLTEVCWAPDGSRLALLGRRSPLLEHEIDSAMYLIPAPAPGAQPQDSEQAPTETRVTDSPYASDLGWSGDDTLVFQAPHDREPQCSYTIWSVAAAGGEPRVVGTASDEPRCTIGLTHSAHGARKLIAIADGLASRLEWLDVDTSERSVAENLEGEVRGLSATEGPSGPVIAAVQMHQGLAACVVAGPPGDLRVVSQHNAEVGPVELGRFEPLLCTAPDGTGLDAVVIRPTGNSRGPYPTAVLVHGGPYGRSGLHSHLSPLDWGQLLASRGFAVVYPNYRGGYGHGNDFAASVRGDMGGAEWGDVLTIVDAAVEAGIADPDRLGIGGWSQGGFLTAWAVTATDRFKVGVMGAGVSDWGMLAATSDLPAFEAVLGGDNRWDGPGPHVADAHSPISYAARRTTPLLILHGAQDQRVPLSQAVAFHRALREQDVPIELVSYPREPHGVRERRHQVDLQNRVVEWFTRYVD